MEIFILKFIVTCYEFGPMDRSVEKKISECDVILVFVTRHSPFFLAVEWALHL